MDEVAIGGPESVPRCRTEVNALGPDRQACLLLRIVHLRQRRSREIRLQYPVGSKGDTPLVRFPLEYPMPIGFTFTPEVWVQ